VSCCTQSNLIDGQNILGQVTKVFRLQRGANT
jgi:hypothetical protein